MPDPLGAWLAWAGAVASASAAACRPALPCRSRARRVDALSAEDPLEEPGPFPPDGTTLRLGRLPLAVGMVSRYWLTPETPGGAIVRIGARAKAVAGIARERRTPITMFLIE
jgi:hypothetical protein